MHSSFVNADALILEGPDAEPFARAQLASDVRALERGHWQWTSWLDARGRVLAFGQLGCSLDGRLLCLLRSGHADTVCERLQMFRMRARVDISLLPAMTLAPGDALPFFELAGSGDEFAFGLGDRSLVLRPRHATGDTHVIDAFLRADIRQGLAWFDVERTANLLPAALALYHLHAVSTTKGCYPGQEIVSRLHHLGGHKQHLHHVAKLTTETNGDLVLTVQGHHGRLLMRVEDEGLAVLRDDAGADRGAVTTIKRFPE